MPAGLVCRYVSAYQREEDEFEPVERDSRQSRERPHSRGHEQEEEDDR
jgi:hypothetical protein